ncbi:MAG TPA: glycosyltransferase family 4 protein [Streptosporangiaceae bacterium]|nr:glycosyltransferase family 4 protein [Streptosporangiaceae bacterium]
MTEPGTGQVDLSGTRIAIVNWRDPWHPEAGGAERHAWEVARGLVARGAVVEFVTSRAPCQSRRDRRDGIGIARMGGRFTVYPLVLAWLAVRRWAFTAVLDCQNGIPFFTPWVLSRRVPVLCVMFHVHTAQFGMHFPGWAARVGRLLEGPAARLAYRRHACVAISPSTVTAMREGLRWPGDIYMIPTGVMAPVLAPPAGPPESGTAHADREGREPVVWVGRLVAHKRAELLLDVAERLGPAGVCVEVVGRGPAAGPLAAQVAERGLGDSLRLHGYLPEEAKLALVSGAMLHLNTSCGEGWGLCVLEAAALGLPTVAFDVPGLRDAVRDGETGWLVKDGERIEDVTQRALKELSDPVRRAAVATACRDWAASFPWEASVARMAGLVHAAIQHGTFRAQCRGAWVVSVAGPAGAHEVVAEGPVLDTLLGEDSPVALVRPATALERLLGRQLSQVADGPP